MNTPAARTTPPPESNALDPTHPAAARWYLACTLDERLAAARTAGVSLIPPGGDAGEPGNVRLARWLGSLQDDPSVLDTRLTTAGATRDELLTLLGEPPAQVQERMLAASGGTPPPWLTRLATLLGPAGGARVRPSEAAPASRSPVSGFLALVEPLVADGIARLGRLVSEAGLPHDLDGLLPGLVAPLDERLVELVERPLTLELHAARLRGLLDGDTPETRFESFTGRLADPAVRLEVLLEHPVLARLSATYVDQWVEVSMELLTRAHEDLPALEQAFGALGALEAVAGASSDPHKGGRHVWFATFSSGTRLVMKPRPMAAEVRFQELVAWLNARGMEPPLRELVIVDRGAHGWMEHVDAGPCEDEHGVRRFHERLGAWLAVLHVLGSTDVHLENLVAAGEHPVPIDHETVLRSRPFTSDIEHDADEAARTTMYETLVGIDLLPSPQWDAGTGAPVDHSGMGAGFADRGVVQVQRLVDVGTDDMRMGVGDHRPRNHENRAVVGGRPIDARARAADVETGFRRAWSLISQHADDLLAPGGPLEAFAEVPVRNIVRPTRAYAVVLEALGHPQFLRDALERELQLTGFWRWLDEQPWRAPLLQSEIDQVAVGDVPYFSTTPGGDDIRCGDGHVAPDAVKQRGLDIARHRIEQLDAQQLDRQVWVIRTTMAGRRFGGPQVGTRLVDDAPSDIDASLQDAAFGLARAAGRRLQELAVHAAGGASWITSTMLGSPADGTDAYRPDIVNDQLYDGLPGIAWFLHDLAVVSGDEDMHGLAVAAMHTFGERMHEATPAVGAYSGWGGWVRTWTRLGTAWGRDDLLDRAVAGAVAIATRLPHDRDLDVISGAAGAIPSLLELDTVRPESRALDVARACGEHLLANAADISALPMSRGFSHGAAGIAWSLAMLGERTGYVHFTDGGLRLARAEQDLLLSSGLWSEHDRPGSPGQSAWCHGPAGIALGRLATWRCTDDDEMLDHARVALTRMLEAEALPSHCLCHGALGNLEPLALAAELLPDEPEWAKELKAASESAVRDIEAHGALCANPRGIESPGLMTGLAGIGHGLLRIAASDRVASVLVPNT